MKYIKEKTLFIILFMLCNISAYSAERNLAADKKDTHCKNEDDSLSKKSKIFWNNQLMVIATVRQPSANSCLLEVIVSNQSRLPIFSLSEANLFKQFQINLIDAEIEKSVSLTEKGIIDKKQIAISSLIIRIESGKQKKYKVQLTDYYVMTKGKSYCLNVSGNFLRDHKTIKFDIQGLIFQKQ
jgi:hypothetical protein